MSELHFSLWVSTILSTPLACTDIDTVVKTANGEGEPSDKVWEIAAAPATEHFVFFLPMSKNEMGEKVTKKQYANTAGLELIHNIRHLLEHAVTFKVQLFNKQ